MKKIFVAFSFRDEERELAAYKASIRKMIVMRERASWSSTR